MTPTFTLNQDEYWNKVFGCWLGKNAGGTLGTPLEKIFGQEEMFDVWWYPKLLPGGMPNDDLEIQIVWLQALKERGVHLTAKDIADYWLKCIHYNYDEYGLHKINLRKGLLPPVSGWYNNWFKHCMGCPIRSEIWACIAPGNPLLAARYAFEDAICDHAGGESVYGEVFNASLEAAAFFLSDRVQLVEFGLQTIPATSQTHGAIKTALNVFKEGIDWKTARHRVMKQFFSPIAQYSPINLGFQTIGLLYGNDFGDAICKAVNCGWDTDCTGATVGSIWGIIHGKDALPQKWLEPLGEHILLSKEIKNLTAPTNLKPLTDETCGLGKQIIEEFNSPIEINNTPTSQEGIEAYLQAQLFEIQKLWHRPPNIVELYCDPSNIRVTLEYPEGPAIVPSNPQPFHISISNFQKHALELYIFSENMTLWQIQPPLPNKLTIEPEASLTITGSVIVPLEIMSPSLQGTLVLQISPDTQKIAIPFPFVGAHAWQFTEVIHPDPKVKNPLKKKFSFEKDRKSVEPNALWESIYLRENNLEIEPFFHGKPGIIYLKHHIWSPDKRKVRMGVPTNQMMRLWLNGKRIHDTKKQIPLRPNYGGDGSNYCNVTLKAGWNTVMIKLMRNTDPIEAHFLISRAEGQHGMADLNQSRYPWQ